MQGIRDSIRTKIFDSKNAVPSNRIISFLGADVEVRQPTLEGISQMAKAKDEIGATDATAMLLFYTYVPGTDEKVFEDGDLEFLAKLPFSKDVAAFMKAVTDMSDIDLQVKVAGKNSEETDSDSGQ